MCVNTMPQRMDISDLREATVANHQSEKGYSIRSFSNNLVDHSAVRKIIHTVRVKLSR